jgi:hypothetical protein
MSAPLIVFAVPDLISDIATSTNETLNRNRGVMQVGIGCFKQFWADLKLSDYQIIGINQKVALQAVGNKK